MEGYAIRRCGSGWAYCDGNCYNCLNAYIAATTNSGENYTTYSSASVPDNYSTDTST